MKKISELYDIDNDTLVNDIKINSKEVVEGDIFVCVNGVNVDRHEYVDEAVKNGAKLIIASKKVDVNNATVIYVDDTNKELINLARNLYDFNDNDLDLIGITGTNGKTTVALMIKELIGESCGYIGTNGIISNNHEFKIRNTTPDADRLYKYFQLFKEDNCKVLSMETSSEAFFRHRLDTLSFKIGIITNITRDHLNIHKTIENYVDCKMELLRKVKKDGFCILNKDDKYYEEAVRNSNGVILTYGKSESDLQIINVEEFIDKTRATLKYKNKLYNIESLFLGEVNVYNLCSALLACICYGFDIETLITRIKNIKIAEGRFEFLNYGQNYKIMLDYAHTLDSFMKVLPFLNKVKLGKLIVITGAAGGRDKEKRAGIGSYILNNSDEVIFTMDDPRNENVREIINDLIGETSNKNYKIIEERETAINYALDNANKDDIILIAGKGRDNYMAIGNNYLPYSDIEVINKYFGGEQK